MKKFWNWIHDDSGGRVLRLDGPIDEDNFWGNEITPAAFRDELEAEEGDVTVWINSPGGSVFAAAEIYTMLKDHKGKITVKIDAIAASAASVVAMAGDTVLMSPVAMLMIHDPMTIAMGNASDMEKAIATLNQVKESIINAYVGKSGISRKKVAQLMSDETWMNAKKAVEMGFADEILFEDKSKPEPEEEPEQEPDEPDKEENGSEEKEKKPFKLEGSDAVWQYSTRIMGETILNRCGFYDKAEDGKPQTGTETPEQPEAGVTPPVADDHIVIGMDGKTKDGAMPYEILKDKLEWMR